MKITLTPETEQEKKDFGPERVYSDVYQFALAAPRKNLPAVRQTFVVESEVLELVGLLTELDLRLRSYVRSNRQ